MSQVFSHIKRLKTSRKLEIFIIIELFFVINLAAAHSSSSNGDDISRFNGSMYYMVITKEGKSLMSSISLVNWNNAGFNNGDNVFLRIRSIKENDSGIFGKVELITKSNELIAASQKPLNMTNTLFWKINTNDEWKQFILARFRNATIPTHFRSSLLPAQYDEIRGIAKIVRFPKNGTITEIIEIDTIHRITIKIAWHNTSSLPRSTSLADLMSITTNSSVILTYQGSALLNQVQEYSDSKNRYTNESDIIFMGMLTLVAVIFFVVVPVRYFTSRLLTTLKSRRATR